MGPVRRCGTVCAVLPTALPMQLRNDLSRSLAPFEQDRTLVVVLELSLSAWLVAGLVPGVVRQPVKKLGADPHELLKLVHRWRGEASRAGRAIERICVAFEAGRDGFWLARWLSAQTWRPTSSTRRASPFPANTGGRRPIGSTRNS